MHNKENLPVKICTVCKRPFTWRKKWANNWDEVKYCSERCRRNKNHEWKSDILVSNGPQIT
ncbi:DUF2256 domain-containing protein [Marinigracilibium pacificum]|uniref:DUF2256 domain-containing protein n=1 Tax=Marinigracilibium pacificum TaxID=2729599 RepID=A0A848IUP2_9BACT|nr:DUF2256 domain-containing protein [Marinigracilibium pacificum]NMM46941.1 DUF2256 domain-containing protein [Marinigracilibium pacificum]